MSRIPKPNHIPIFPILYILYKYIPILFRLYFHITYHLPNHIQSQKSECGNKEKQCCYDQNTV